MMVVAYKVVICHGNARLWAPGTKQRRVAINWHSVKPVV